MVQFLGTSRWATLVLLALASKFCEAAIAAWWTAIGPQVILQNTSTGLIRYSACNSYDTPIYLYNDATFFSNGPRPKNGTALSGGGWYDADNKQTVASVFYQAVDYTIVNLYAKCNMTTGRFDTQASYIVSGDAPSVHHSTGLACVLLGAVDGYRVYFHDADLTLRQLSYTLNTGWQYSGWVNRDVQKSTAIAANFHGSVNITIVTARDAKNIEVTRWSADNSWYITTFPQPLAGVDSQNTTGSSFQLNTTTPASYSLPGWNGNPGSLGLSIEPDGNRNVFYIGTDARLYQASNPNTSPVWSLNTHQTSAIWPAADGPSAELGLASESDSDAVRIYYMVNRRLWEIKYGGGVWSPAAALATVNASSSTANMTSGSSDARNNGLSAGAKAGIGAGVALGGVALVGIGLAAMRLSRRRQRRRKEDQQQQQQQQDQTAHGHDSKLRKPGGRSEMEGEYAAAWQPTPSTGASSEGQPWQGRDGGQRGAELRTMELAPAQLDSLSVSELPAAQGYHELPAAEADRW